MPNEASNMKEGTKIVGAIEPRDSLDDGPPARSDSNRLKKFTISNVILRTRLRQK